ncbi:hypothetical protein WDU94_005922 [Cyamophila willieti]
MLPRIFLTIPENTEYDCSSSLRCSFCNTDLTKDSNLILKHKCCKSTTPFQCCICEESFKLKWILKRHLIKHTREKAYSCFFCDYKSAYLCDIKKHTRNHTGERPYKCALCAYAGKTAWNLKLHTGRLHAEFADIFYPVDKKSVD